MTYFTVFGRLLGDDDDSCLVTKAKDDNDDSCLVTKAKDDNDAIEQFHAWLAEGHKYKNIDPEKEIYISYILKSSTKPKIVFTPWGAS